MIDTVSDLGALRAQVRDWKRAGLRVGFVPTMGNLHAGHYSLVELARTHADRVVASVFVNPTQFGPNEDFARYPRTPQADAAGLAAAGCDLLWLPAVDTMYPHGVDATVQVRVPGVSQLLEGAHRIGHFDGVATVVARLFNQVQPDVAIFGRKDYQQLAVIRYLVRDVGFPVEILAGETLREADGLAMSSRNQYLSADERRLAPQIHQALLQMEASVAANMPCLDIEAAARSGLEAHGFIVDYAVVRRSDLTEPAVGEGGALVALIAARLGRTRLIDNISFVSGNPKAS
ncbi:MAG: pantoate--beta-alanine ligase [Luteimonas sp.]